MSLSTHPAAAPSLFAPMQSANVYGDPLDLTAAEPCEAELVAQLELQRDLLRQTRRADAQPLFPRLIAARQAEHLAEPCIDREHDSWAERMQRRATIRLGLGGSAIVLATGLVLAAFVAVSGGAY